MQACKRTGQQVGHLRDYSGCALLDFTDRRPAQTARWNPGRAGGKDARVEQPCNGKIGCRQERVSRQFAALFDLRCMMKDLRDEFVAIDPICRRAPNSPPMSSTSTARARRRRGVSVSCSSTIASLKASELSFIMYLPGEGSGNAASEYQGSIASLDHGICGVDRERCRRAPQSRFRAVVSITAIAVCASSVSAFPCGKSPGPMNGWSSSGGVTIPANTQSQRHSDYT